MRSRCGKAPPPSIVCGMASAAASDTAPRMPVHATMAGNCQCTAGSRSRTRRESSRGA